MVNHKYVGKDYQTPDLIAKVTGRAKYAEDYRADGMLFCKLMLSPMPHARIRNIDAIEALKMEGVVAILTADDMPPIPPSAQGAPAPLTSPPPEVALTKEPVYQGEPILALAAVDEYTAAEAIERIRVDLEPLPFVIDPLDSLRPDGPNARAEGNVFTPEGIKTIKWTDTDFAAVEQGKFPMNATAAETNVIGNVEEALNDADLVLEETWYQQSTPHQPLESRSAMAYWQNGKLYLHGSTQSVSRTVASVAGWVGIDPKDVVILSPYTGGAFGSKIPGAQSMAIPALLARKTGRPVMMRVSREEETYIGRVRPAFQAGIRAGFRKDGRLVALDMFIVQASGPYQRQPDSSMAANVSSLLYQPETLRFRSISVATNTPPPATQRAPGGLQAMEMMEPIVSKAARKLGIDQVEIRKMNAPITGSPVGLGTPERPRQKITGAFVREAFDKGAKLFNWDERKKRSGRRHGTKVTGVSAAASTFMAGATGFDGLLVIRADGKIEIHQGIGNLGTHSVTDTARWVAEVLDTPWQQCEVVWGDTSRHIPWSSTQSGSRTAHAHSRTNYAAALDARRKLQQIAAKNLGGAPETYQVSNGRVFLKGNPATGLTFAQAARRAVELGGKFDGHELPGDINSMTSQAAAALVGRGVMGVAKDNFPQNGSPYSFAVGFAEIEVDVETGAYRIMDYLAVVDVGTVLHPRSLGGQILGGFVQGFGHTRSQRLVYDKHYGALLSTRLHYNKPPTILDIPYEKQITWDAVGIPDPQTPTGVKGVGEAVIGAGAAALLCALADAIGDDLIRRTPVLPEMILTGIEAGTRTHDPLKAYI